MVVVVCSYVVSGLALVVSLLRRIHCALVPRGGGGGVRVVCVVKEKEFAIERGRLSVTPTANDTHKHCTLRFWAPALAQKRERCARGEGVLPRWVCLLRAGPEEQGQRAGREGGREVAPSLRQTTKVEVVVINIKRR